MLDSFLFKDDAFCYLVFLVSLFSFAIVILITLSFWLVSTVVSNHFLCHFLVDVALFLCRFVILDFHG